MLRRVVNRYNGEVNGYFLCDRGRFGYEFVNSERRIRQPLRQGQIATAEAALGYLRDLASGKVIGIGSPRASLESNFALRMLVGEGRFYAGIAATESQLLKLMLEIQRNGPLEQQGWLCIRLPLTSAKYSGCSAKYLPGGIRRPTLWTSVSNVHTPPYSGLRPL